MSRSLAAASAPSGIVSVTVRNSMGEARRRSMAGPQKTAWVAPARMRAAPNSSRIRAASVIEPAVVIMSSTSSAVRPTTSPTTLTASVSVAVTRRLSTAANGQPSRSA